MLAPDRQDSRERQYDRGKKIQQITESLQKQIKLLLSNKPSGKILLTVELNMSQGFLASANLRCDSNIHRERIF